MNVLRKTARESSVYLLGVIVVIGVVFIILFVSKSPADTKLPIQSGSPSQLPAPYPVPTLPTDISKIRVVDRFVIVPELVSGNPVPSWSPDGSFIAFGGKGKTLYVTSYDGKEVKAVDYPDNGFQNIVWSADGKEIVYIDSTWGEDAKITLVNIKTEEKKVLDVISKEYSARDLDWYYTPNEVGISYLVKRKYDRDGYGRNITSKDKVRRVLIPLKNRTDNIYSQYRASLPFGNLSTDHSEPFQFIDLQNRRLKILDIQTRSDDFSWFTIWSPDKSILSHVGTKSGFFISDLRKGVSRNITEIGFSETPYPSPDGAYIAFYKEDIDNHGTPLASELYIVSTETFETRQLTNTSDFMEWGPVWSPDGKKIVFYDESKGTDGISIILLDW